MTHDIKQLSVQQIKSLIALRTDRALELSKELTELTDEIYDLKDELSQRWHNENTN